MGMKITMEDYEITRNGEIINLKTGRILKPQPNNKGYLRVSLCEKKYFVHRLVAEKYLPNPNKLEQVNHKNGIKTDNRVDNLEWVTNQTNRKHAVEMGLHLSGEKCSWAKLNWDKVSFIRNNPQISTKELAEKFNVSVATIRNVRNYKTWKNS